MYVPHRKCSFHSPRYLPQAPVRGTVAVSLRRRLRAGWCPWFLILRLALCAPSGRVWMLPCRPRLSCWLVHSNRDGFPSLDIDDVSRNRFGPPPESGHGRTLELKRQWGARAASPTTQGMPHPLPRKRQHGRNQPLDRPPLPDELTRATDSKPKRVRRQGLWPRGGATFGGPAPGQPRGAYNASKL
jgi:hypothetical protein